MLFAGKNYIAHLAYHTIYLFAIDLRVSTNQTVGYQLSQRIVHCKHTIHISCVRGIWTFYRRCYMIQEFLGIHVQCTCTCIYIHVHVHGVCTNHFHIVLLIQKYWSHQTPIQKYLSRRLKEQVNQSHCTYSRFNNVHVHTCTCIHVLEHTCVLMHMQGF